VLQVALHFAGTYGELVGAQQSAVFGGDSERGPEDGDLGDEFGVGGDEWACPLRGARWCPLACGGADLVGKIGGQFGSGGQVLAPLRTTAQRVGHGW
jgi:hypothetical protein